MNAKFGMLLGVNLAVASVFMQGCKATKSGGGTTPSPRSTPAAQQPVQQPAPKTAAQHDIETTRYTEPKTAQQPAPDAGKAPPKAVKPKADKPLPPPEPEYTEYTVKKGDMLSRICAKYGVKQRDVLKLNPGLNPNLLFVGKKIRLPGVVEVGAAPAPAPAAKGAAPAKDPKAQADVKDSKPAQKGSAANLKAPVTKKAAYKPYDGPTKEYVVKSGDQIGKIALAFGITRRALKELNGLADDNIRVGQKLKVPAEKVKADEKKVEEKKVDEKKVDEKKAEPSKDEANGADAKAAPAPAPSNDAGAGGTPAANDGAQAATPAPAPAPEAEAAAPAAPTTYVVKEGDDIVAISIKFGVQPSALLDINDLKPDAELKPGQVLKLPPDAKLQ